MVKEDLVELAIQDQHGQLKLRRKEERSRPYAAPVAAVPAPTSLQEAHIPAGAVKVKAPLGGVFYRSPAPGAANFVSEGEDIKKGQIICIIEAMKMMNEIQSETSGKVIKILVVNGKRVESGQPLILIMPS
ncbi:MAG: acetyl-CoA carboxylase, biotin carboxyl carrier protein [Elusimicrobia bacterium]|nr:acetyl-CoA carboxylase, biotin carboxyl carrier protein [Elusimicrobiota bacterium]